MAHHCDDSCIDQKPTCLECGRPPIDCECDECPTCKGRGTVNPLTAPERFFCAGTTDCPHCDGTGRVE